MSRFSEENWNPAFSHHNVVWAYCEVQMSVKLNITLRKIESIPLLPFGVMIENASHYNFNSYSRYSTAISHCAI